MNGTMSLVQRGIDPLPLLLAHLACADRQLHQREMRFIEQTAYRQAQDATRTAVDAVFAQTEDHVRLTEVLKAIPPQAQSAALEQALSLACADGVKAPEELHLLVTVAEQWGISPGSLRAHWEAAKAEVAGDDPAEVHLARPGLLTLAFDALFGTGFLDRLATEGPEKWRKTLDRRRRGALLAGPEYETAVQRCAEVAQQDFSFVRPKLDDCISALERLLDDLGQSATLPARPQGRGQHAKQAAEAINQIQQDVRSNLQPLLQRVREALFAKHRALHRLTVAFMGRTKAGKSTLHAVVTGDGWEAIGVGGQRTTRFNRVYDWRNLRIIDTPGIGAPDQGGRTDEEIAESVIDEADIVCFVVTNDSQQQADFQLLKKLKEKGKPLVILLNVKANLDTPSRQRRFLAAPERCFQMKGDNDLLGHVNRIRRYAQQCYGNDFFDIVPVQLYAARLAREGNDHELSEQLWEASHAQDFLDALQLILVREGPIHRSQTLIGSTVCDVAAAAEALATKARECAEMATRFQHAATSSAKQIEDAQTDAMRTLHTGLNGVFNGVRHTIQRFAEEHWDDDSDSITKAWKAHLDNFEFNEQLTAAIRTAGGEFEQAVQEILEEVGRELRTIAHLGLRDASVTGAEDIFAFKAIAGIGGSIVGLAGAVVLVWHPIGWVIIGIGAFIGMLSLFLKSPEEKRRKAAAQIADQLHQNLNNQEKKVIQEQSRLFVEQSGQVRSAVADYFAAIEKGLMEVATNCHSNCAVLSKTPDQLNMEFARRIVEWMAAGQERPPRIVRVERQPGRYIRICTATPFAHEFSHEYVCRVLQEELDLRNH